MSRIQKEFVKFEGPKMRSYTREELQKFSELIQKFYEDKLLNFKKLSTAYGATTEENAIILNGFRVETDYKGTTVYRYDTPTRQSQLDNLLSQYYWWKSGQDWIEKKQVEAFQNTSSSSFVEKKPSSAEEVFAEW